MVSWFKHKLYFITASYFAFWARLVLMRWKPLVVVVTGSSGKTTLLHLAETQLGANAHYGHHANGAFGVPFDILGLPTNVSHKLMWFVQMTLAPLKAISVHHNQKIYVAEADCDRPGEGLFLAKLLRPDYTLWVSAYHTHSQNFDKVVSQGLFASPIDAIVHEFGHFARFTKKLVVYNADISLLENYIRSLSGGTESMGIDNTALQDFQVNASGTKYIVNGKDCILPGVQPRAVGVSIAMLESTLQHMGVEYDPRRYQAFQLPPGRGSIFNGKNNTLLVDSTYNTGVVAAKEILEAFAKLSQPSKWLVVGDVLEQGSVEESEHQTLARHILAANADRVVLLGKRQKRYGYPLLKSTYGDKVQSFDTAGDVLHYLQQNLQGGEAILFKGAQGLEGVVEQMLADPNQASQLVRREKSWVKRRQAWGLPR